MRNKPHSRLLIAVVAVTALVMSAIGVAFAARLGGVQSASLDAWNIAQKPVIPTGLTWTTVAGAATVSQGGTTVAITGTAENRVRSTATNMNNLVFSGTAQGASANGYSILFRASFNGSSSTIATAYEFLVGNGSFRVRQWNNNNVCDPFITVPFPPGFSATNANTFSVSAQGNVLTITINGATVINVPSLTAAITAGPCPTWAVPSGGTYGFRTDQVRATFSNITVV